MSEYAGMNQYKISCTEWNPRHVKFNVFDRKGANCGALTVDAADIRGFLHCWAGAIFWNGKIPDHEQRDLRGAERAIRAL